MQGALLCPSCQAKRLEIWADWLEHELVYRVPHRQYVFTVPKRLRPFFLFDRKLLGLLSRVAYRTLREFMCATLREPHAVPGVVSSIQTFGSLANWHPHLHLLITDGVFRDDGTFIHLGFHEIEQATEAFRRSLLREFVRRELLTQDQAASMLAWPHSGFHVHHAVRLEADDPADGAYVWSRQPDYIMFPGYPISNRMPGTKGGRELFAIPQFRSTYRSVTMPFEFQGPIDDRPRQYVLHLWQRVDAPRPGAR